MKEEKVKKDEKLYSKICTTLKRGLSLSLYILSVLGTKLTTADLKYIVVYTKSLIY